MGSEIRVRMVGGQGCGVRVRMMGSEVRSGWWGSELWGEGQDNWSEVRVRMVGVRALG